VFVAQLRTHASARAIRPGVDDLGVVRRTARRTEVGKEAVMDTTNGGAFAFASVGIDMGESTIKGGLLRNGRLGTVLSVETERSSAAARVDQVVDLIEQLRTRDTVAVGVGPPSVVEHRTGTVLSGSNVSFHGFPMREVLGERLGLPVAVDNDATLAIYAEAHQISAGQVTLVAPDLVGVTLGSGLGGGIVREGRIFRSRTSSAALFGDMLVFLGADGEVPAGATFPQAGSWETWASGWALDRMAREAASRYRNSALGKLLSTQASVDGGDAVSAARDGDQIAIAVVRRWARAVGAGVASLISVLDPAEFVLAGGAAQAGDLLLDPVREVVQSYCLDGVGTHTNIRLARHGTHAGILGACLLALAEAPDSSASHATG
jgi:glucokinase